MNQVNNTVKNIIPAISFIIPCRNEKEYITETISSVLNQKDINKNFEIIIIDGSSDDGTREILSDLKKQDSRINVIDNQKKITPVALNLGVKKATGTYIFILGAHAKIAEDYAISCLQIFNTHQEVSCAGGPITSIGKTPLGKAIAFAMSSAIGVGNARHRFPEYEGYAEMACFPVFKKNVFEQIGYFDEELVRNQDDDLCFRLRLNGGKVYISSKAKSFYYVRENIKSLFKQYYEYGFWRIALLKKHKLQIAFRQQIPFIFFLIVTILLVVGLLLNNISLAFTFPAVYLGVLIIYTFVIIGIKKKKYVCWLPVVIFILHTSYAIGFAQGLVKSIIKIKD